MNAFRKMLDDRLGMFVHYGIYSALAGRYNGKEIEGLGEWIQRRAQIPIAEYEKIGRESFLPAKDYAKRLVASAKAAGVRYIVLTAKHHDGFALFKTAVDGYNTYDFYGRDLCAELADECRKAGLEVGFYYSHTLDWHEKNAAGNIAVSGAYRADNRNFWDFPNDDIDFSQYFNDKCLPQVRELLTGYGKLKLIWFDFPHDITCEQSLELKNLVKELQPDCLINSRIGYGLCDYYSMGDNSLPSQPNGLNNECLITLNNTWGYKESDNAWKPAEDVIEILCRALTSDSSLLINVGPYANGYLTPETEQILSSLSEWTERNGEAIYNGVSGNPLSTVFEWGHIAIKDRRLLLFIKDRGVGTVRISGIEGADVLGARILGSDAEVKASVSGDELCVAFSDTCTIFPVVEITFSTAVTYSSLIKQNGSVLNLPIQKALVSHNGNEPEPILAENDYYHSDYGKRGLSVNCETALHSWDSSDDEIVWEAYVTQGGEYTAKVISAPIQTDAAFTLSVADKKYPLPCGWSGNFCISLTGEQNKRFVKAVDGIKIDSVGRCRIGLSMDSDGVGLKLTEIKLTKNG